MAVAVDVQQRDGFTVLTVAGEVDVYSAPALRERMNEVIAGGQPWLIADLTGVPFMDSTGLGVLVGRLKATRQQGGELRLVITDDRLLRNFKITGLDTVFAIHADVDEAVAAG